MLLQICHRLTVDLNDLEGARLLNEELGHHTHTWSYFQDRKIRTRVNCIGNLLGDVQISQEMLTQIFLRSYLLHADKGTHFFSDRKVKNEKSGQDSHLARFLMMLSLFLSSQFYLTPKFMSLLILNASVAHTATTNVIINNKVIVYYLCYP